MNNFKKYLPSKKFISIVLIIVIFITLFFTLRGIISFLRDRKLSNSGPTKILVKNLIQKDSNNNGIADWEEYLWGLNPNKNGLENKEFILAKKKLLEENGVISVSDDSNKITENEIVSREFFATIMSLQQTGELNEESINSVSEAIGQRIQPTPINDIYLTSRLTIQNDSLVANKNYGDKIKSLILKYQDADIGSELTLIIQGLGNKDPQALYAAQTIASSYKLFGSELIKISVPRSLAQTHLSLANNYEKTGQSIDGLTKMLSDPILGMNSIINYKKYSDALASDLEKISGVLQ